MKIYKSLNKQEFNIGNFKITPIRYKDRFKIMKWRNEQVYHLRQNGLLNKKDQENYFKNVISKNFNNLRPHQLLFSFLENEVLIGYGGLVNINWIDKNAEISFLINTELETLYFNKYWCVFLKLIQNLAFQELSFYKIYTYAFDIRPKLYDSLEKEDFILESRLKDHSFIDGKYIDVIIHSKINDKC